MRSGTWQWLQASRWETRTRSGRRLTGPPAGWPREKRKTNQQNSRTHNRERQWPEKGRGGHVLVAPPPAGTPGPPQRQASLTRPSAAAAGCAVVVTQRKNAGGMCCLLHPQARPGRHSARPASRGPAPQQPAEPSLSDSREGRRGGHVLAAPPPCTPGPPQRQANLTRPSAAAAG